MRPDPLLPLVGMMNGGGGHASMCRGLASVFLGRGGSWGCVRWLRFSEGRGLDADLFGRRGAVEEADLVVGARCSVDGCWVVCLHRLGLMSESRSGCGEAKAEVCQV